MRDSCVQHPGSHHATWHRDELQAGLHTVLARLLFDRQLSPDHFPDVFHAAVAALYALVCASLQTETCADANDSDDGAAWDRVGTLLLFLSDSCCKALRRIEAAAAEAAAPRFSWPLCHAPADGLADVNKEAAAAAAATLHRCLDGAACLLRRDPGLLPAYRERDIVWSDAVMAALSLGVPAADAATAGVERLPNVRFCPLFLSEPDAWPGLSSAVALSAAAASKLFTAAVGTPLHAQILLLGGTHEPLTGRALALRALLRAMRGWHREVMRYRHKVRSARLAARSAANLSDRAARRALDRHCCAESVAALNRCAWLFLVATVNVPAGKQGAANFPLIVLDALEHADFFELLDDVLDARRAEEAATPALPTTAAVSSKCHFYEARWNVCSGRDAFCMPSQKLHAYLPSWRGVAWPPA